MKEERMPIMTPEEEARQLVQWWEQLLAAEKAARDAGDLEKADHFGGKRHAAWRLLQDAIAQIKQ